MKAAVIRLAMRVWPALAIWLVGDRSYLNDRMQRRYYLLTQLHHEMSKVRQGGYWRESGWEFRLGFRSVVPTKFRWTPR